MEQPNYYSDSDLAAMDDESLTDLANDGKISTAQLMTAQILKTGTLDDPCSLRARMEKELLG